MIGLLIIMAAISGPTSMIVKCDLGRVVGADADNKAIIKGDYKFNFVVLDHKVKTFSDPGHILFDSVSEPNITFFNQSSDSTMTLTTPRIGDWRSVFSIDPLKSGEVKRTATITRLHISSQNRADGEFDSSRFYFGYCDAKLDADAIRHFEALK